MVLFVACGGSQTRDDAKDPCARLGAKLIELAERDGRDHMTPMLPKVKAALIRECRADKWSESTRSCLLSATSAADASKRCAITWGPVTADKPTQLSNPQGTAEIAKTPVIQQCTKDGLSGRYITCLRSLESGHRPKALRFSPDGKQLWVALHYDRPAVEVFDTTTWALLGAVDLGEYGAVELAFSPDGKRAYASQYETASIFEIDTKTRTARRQLRTNSKASKVITVSPDGERIFVANWSGKDITEFAAATGERVRAFPVAGIPRGMFVTDDQRSLYVTSFSPGKLFKIDLASGSVATIYDKGRAIRHIVGDRARQRLYVSDLGNSNIYVVDLITDRVRVLAKANNKTNTIDLSPDGKVLFASNRGRNNPDSFLLAGPERGSIQAFDTTSGTLLDTVVAGNQTTGLSVSPDGALLAATDFLDNRVNVYRLAPSGEMLKGNGADNKDKLNKRGFKGEPRAPHNPAHWNQLPAPVPRFKPTDAARTSR